MMRPTLRVEAAERSHGMFVRMDGALSPLALSTCWRAGRRDDPAVARPGAAAVPDRPVVPLQSRGTEGIPSLDRGSQDRRPVVRSPPLHCAWRSRGEERWMEVCTAQRISSGSAV